MAILMANWHQNDTAVDDHYREQYTRAYGYDPLDLDWTEDDIPDFEEDTYDADESDAV